MNFVKITYNGVKNGDIVWHKDGLTHRDDGPAEITRFTNKWYYEGKLHREGGPAIERKEDLRIPDEYWIHGIFHNPPRPTAIKKTFVETEYIAKSLFERFLFFFVLRFVK